MAQNWLWVQKIFNLVSADEKLLWNQYQSVLSYVLQQGETDTCQVRVEVNNTSEMLICTSVFLLYYFINFLCYPFALFKSRNKDCIASSDESHFLFKEARATVQMFFIHLQLTFCSVTCLQLIPYTVQYTIFTQTWGTYTFKCKHRFPVDTWALQVIDTNHIITIL